MIGLRKSRGGHEVGQNWKATGMEGLKSSGSHSKGSMLPFGLWLVVSSSRVWQG